MRSESREKEMEERIEAASRGKERGEELTERDRIPIQYTLGAGACDACGRPGITVATRIVPGVEAQGSVR